MDDHFLDGADGSGRSLAGGHARGYTLVRRPARRRRARDDVERTWTSRVFTTDAVPLGVAARNDGAAWRRLLAHACALLPLYALRGADGLRADHFYLTRSRTDWLSRLVRVGSDLSLSLSLQLSSGQLPRNPLRRDTIFEGVVTGNTLPPSPALASQKSGEFSG